MQHNHPFHFFHFATRHAHIVRAILPRCHIDVEFSRLGVGQLIVGNQLSDVVEHVNTEGVCLLKIIT
jgi:hypothetical protein